MTRRDRLEAKMTRRREWAGYPEMQDRIWEHARQVIEDER